MEDFRQALRAFLIEACKLLASEPPQLREWTRIVREESGQISFPTETRPDFSKSLFHFRIHHQDTPIDTFNRIVDSIQGEPRLRSVLLIDGAGKPITEEKTQIWWLENMVTGCLLQTYIDRANSLQFDDQICNELLNDFEKDIGSPDVTVTKLSPLLNVEIESNRIQIDANVCLRQLSTDELEQWLNVETLLSSHPLNIFDFHVLKTAIEVVYKQNRYLAIGSHTEGREKTARLITAIRLFTDATPRLLFTKTQTSSLFTSGFSTSWGPSVIRPCLLAKIEKSQELGLLELYNRLVSGPNINGVRLAVARWNSAVDRFSEEDKLIDHWIALESLFVPDSSQELSYRTALRIAAFLGSNGVERKRIYEQMKESYRLRSEIVHGSIRKRRKKPSSIELINFTHFYLRQALLKILESSERFDPSKFETKLLGKE